MTLSSQNPVLHRHLQNLINQAFPVDEGCCGWRLKTSSPSEISLAAGELFPKSSPGFSVASPLVFLDRLAGELMLHFHKPALDEQRSKLSEVAAQVACLLACKNTEAAVLLDIEVANQKAAHADFNWYGIYRVEGSDLLLTSFRGAPSPHIKIPTDAGICGAAVRENRTLNIEDVGADPRYLSCSLETKSELVVPIRDSAGRAIAEIDIDAHKHSAFTPELVALVEGFAGRLMPLVVKLQ
jgi:putative methionine-R-sulfoxide reductase with GAF domain